MGEEGEREDEGDDGGVVDFEVGEVLADPGEGVGERVGSLANEFRSASSVHGRR